MNNVRTHFWLVVTAVLSAGVYFYRVFDLDMDLLAVVGIAVVIFASFKDIRLLFVGWFLLAPYFVPLAAEGSANIASNITHNYFVPVISIITLTYYYLKGKRVTLGKEDLLMLAFVAYAIFSSLYATKGRYDDLRGIYLIYLIPFFLYFVVKHIDVDSRFLTMLAYASFFHLVQVVLLGIYEMQHGTTLYPATPKVNWVDVGSMRRLTGALGTPIILGVFLQVLFGFLYLAYRQGTISRFIMRLAVPLFVVLNVMTFTRSVWLGAILSYMYLAYKASEETKIKFVRVLAPAAFAVMLIGVLMAVSPDVQSRISGEENANFRVVMAQASLYMIADSPVVGWGQGTFDEHADRYLFDARGVYIVSDTSHVTLLTILAELGIVGFTLYLLFIMLNLKPRGITSSDMSRGDGEIIAVMRGTFIAFAVNALLIDMRFYSLAYSWFFVSLGVITNIYRENLSQREGEA